MAGKTGMATKMMRHIEKHPEDADVLNLWMVSASTAREIDPDACARFEKLFPGEAGK